MAASRRSSQQQQQSLLSPPRNTAISPSPPGTPPAPVGAAATSAPVGVEQENSDDTEIIPASPDLPALSLSNSSSSTTTTTGVGSSGGSSPDSGTASPGSIGGGCGTSGAFRELFEACRNGDVSRVKRLVDTGNVNAKDMAGRKSTPLHFAAGQLSACWYSNV
ncbi:UNVERIFIED_CONTAM: hypothetical protein FKN15_066529 [Acipenser sinensis]